jgi:NADH-quinone oxidoreductase subunit N
MTSFNYSDLVGILPILSTTVLSLCLLALDAILRKGISVNLVIALIGILVGICCAVLTFPLKGTAFGGMIITGGYSSFFSIALLSAALLTIMLSKSYLEKQGIAFGEYYTLVCFATVGMMLMASGMDLIVIFLGLELMSICLYILSGFFRKRPKSNESALKYFLLGSFATGFLLYGIALVYGASGTTNLDRIFRSFPGLAQQTIFWIGSGLVIVGLSFKVAAFPFHMWVPDVYEGAPTTVSAFMSTGGKCAAFGAYILFLTFAVGSGNERIRDIIAVLSVSSMILGNMAAVSQNNIKRMLAYSSIAHAGYMLIGLAASNTLGRSGVLYYLISYTFMQIGAFGVVSIIERQDESNLEISDYAGLGVRRPFLAAMMSVFMFSLAGIPPFAGFFAKYYVFLAAINAGMTWLAIVGVLASLVSVYFYIGVVVSMYFRQYENPKSVETAGLGLIALGISSLAVLVLGVLPSQVIEIANSLF